jgi:hypothetical protein
MYRFVVAQMEAKHEEWPLPVSCFPAHIFVDYLPGVVVEIAAVGNLLRLCQVALVQRLRTASRFAYGT